MSTNTPSSLTFKEAIAKGEYDPKFLSTFSEWNGLSRDVQFEYVLEALKNRESQYIRQYAEISNVLDFSKKPHLQQILDNIMQKIRALRDDRERLYLEFSSI